MASRGVKPASTSKFDFALIAEPGQDAAVAGGIGTGEQQAAGFGEGEFEIHLFAHQRRHWRCGRDARALGEVALRSFGRHGLNDAGLQSEAGAARTPRRRAAWR